MSSGAILARFTLKAAPTLTGSGPYVAQTFGLSTGDTNLTGIDIVGDGATCKFWAGYISGLTWSDSLDLSQGKGGFAEATSGELTVIDATADTSVSLSAAIRSGLVVLEGATVWAAALPAGGTFADVKKLRQFQVVGDPSVSGGDEPTVTLHLRSASWLASGTLETTINRSQIVASADDPQNPSDPAYPLGPGLDQPFRTSAGNVFGGIDVSIKAGEVQPVQILCRYDRTTEQAGDVGTTDGPIAYISSTRATAFSPGVYSADTGGSFGALTDAAGLWFGCRTSTDLGAPADLTEAQALFDLIELYKAKGYRIILSDGSWFLDIGAQTHSAENVICPIPEFAGFSKTSSNLFTKGYDVVGSPAFPLGPTAPYAGVLFNLCDYSGDELFFSEIDPASAQIFAVPDSIPIAVGQMEVAGIAVDGDVIPASIDLSSADGVLLGRPACASQSAIVVAKALPLRMTADPQPGTANRFGRAYMDPNVPVTTSISGDLADIDIHASSTYNVGGPSATQTLSMKLRLSPEPANLSIGMIDVSYSTKVILNGRTGPFAFWGPYWKRPDVFPNPIFNRSIEYDASPRPKTPIWKKVFQSLADSFHDTQLVTKNNLTGQTNTVAFAIHDAFMWDFQKISFSSVYPVVYPFFRRFGFEQIAASPTVVCGVDGTGEIAIGTISGQNIAWTSTSPAVTTDSGVPRWTGIAYDGAGRFLTIGCLANAETADNRMIFAASTDGGATWTTSKDATFPGHQRSPIFCDGNRWVIVATGTNSIRSQLVSGYPGAWTDLANSRAYSTACGNGSRWLVGGPLASGHNLATTANFAALGTQTVGTTEEVVSISWIPASKTWLLGMADGSVWYSTVATDATIPTAWTKVDVFAGGLTTLGNWSGITVEAFGFDADGRAQQMGSTDGANWIERDSRPDVAIYHTIYTNPSGTGIWIATPSANQLFGQVMTSDSVARNWTPWATPSPSTALQKLRSQRFGGIGAYDYNPLRWSGLAWTGDGDLSRFAISFDPGGDDTPSTAVAKICEEWWGFAGEFAGDVDASNDPIEEALPIVNPGDVEDVYSELTFDYHRFGDAYQKTAYIRNVDTAYVAGNDAFYFGGWDPVGTNTNGLDIWNECRASFLRYGTKRELKRSFDSIHDEFTMGALWVYVHPDLGKRIRHITRQPRYLSLKVAGVFGSTQDIASWRASSGCRYKANQTMIAAQNWSLPEWGIVTSFGPDPITGQIELEIMYAPE